MLAYPVFGLGDLNPKRKDNAYFFVKCNFHLLFFLDFILCYRILVLFIVRCFVEGFSNFLPAPLVWSYLGPVFCIGAGPERRFQSNTSDVDCRQPEHSQVSKLQNARGAPKAIKIQKCVIFINNHYLVLLTPIRYTR